MKALETISTQIQEYNQTAAALAELNARYGNVVWSPRTTDGMAAAKKARAEVKGYRTELEAKRKELKAPALERCRLIDDEAKRITAELLKLEEPIDQVIKAEEARIAAEKAEKERIERERVNAIRAKIGHIAMVPASLTSRSSGAIQEAIDGLRVPELVEFAEFTGEALVAHSDALMYLNRMFETALAREQEDARRDAERVALAEAKAKAEAEAAEQRRIEAEKLAAEREELARLKAELDAIAAGQRAEQARLAARQQAEMEAKRIADEEREKERIYFEKMEQAKADHDELMAELARRSEESAELAERLDGKPSDNKIIDSVALSFHVDFSTAKAWIQAMDINNQFTE